MKQNERKQKKNIIDEHIDLGWFFFELVSSN